MKLKYAGSMSAAASLPTLRIAPTWGLFARELAAVVNPNRFRAPRDGVSAAADLGRPVLVIPGFLASDTATRPLRMGLKQAGFRAHGWKRGRNFGLDGDIFDIIDARVKHISRGSPVAIVGWSLGGLIAREYAKRSPELVERVVTLGSPICGDPRRNNNVWRLYELVAGHPVDTLPVACVLQDKPPVETIAIWSRNDGIVAADSACAADCADRSIEIGCGHMEMVFAPEAIRAVARALA